MKHTINWTRHDDKSLKAGYDDFYNVMSYILYRHLQLFDNERQST